MSPNTQDATSYLINGHLFIEPEKQNKQTLQVAETAWRSLSALR